MIDRDPVDTAQISCIGIADGIFVALLIQTSGERVAPIMDSVSCGVRGFRHSLRLA